jgi:hypothetical protein
MHHHYADHSTPSQQAEDSVTNGPSPVAPAGAQPGTSHKQQPDNAVNPTQRADRILRTTAVAAGVLIAAYTSFAMAATEVTEAAAEGQNLTEHHGPAAVLLALLPALLAAIPAWLPPKTRTWAGAAGATALTAFCFTAGNLGVYLFPIALLLWATTIVPPVLRRGIGRNAARAWHLTAAALLALPALPAATAIFADDTEIIWFAVGLWIVAPLTLAVLCASGTRAGYAMTAIAGALVMLAALLDQGFLFAAFWLFGAVYLTIGTIGYAASLRPPIEN